MEPSLKEKTLSGILWQFMQRIIGQLLSFVVTVILARLLLPEDYGVVALAGMFNVLIGIFMTGSMDSALIQKKDADELDCNTVFFSSLFMSFVIYGVVFAASPYVASMFGNGLICPIMRVSALTMPVASFVIVQNAIISRDMAFKKLFYVSFVIQLPAAALGIYMAYSGYGPWALVGQQMLSAIINAAVLYVIVPWRPRLMFSWVRFRQLFDFAWKKTAAGFIGTLCGQLKGYLIGYRYTPADLAYYNRGEGLPDMLMNNVSCTINSVLFPALSKVQGDVGAVKRATRRSMMVGSYIVTPFLFGLAATASQLVVLLYSHRWASAVPFMQVACLTAAMTVLNAANLQALLAIGRSEVVLKLEMYKKPVMLLILAFAVFISPLAISVGMFLYSIYVLFMNAWPNRKYLDYSVWEQIDDVKSGFILSSMMALLVWLAGNLFSNVYLSLFFQILLGMVFYITASHLLKLEAYCFAKKIFVDFIARYRRG